MSTVAAQTKQSGAGIGIWLLLIHEVILFVCLFIVYAVYRFKNPIAFHLASEELSVGIGTLNTVFLFISSMTVTMSISAIQQKQRFRAGNLLTITLLMGFIFMVNKYFEWSGKFGHGIYPGSEKLAELGQGEILFFVFYYALLGLQALHVIIGMVLLMILLSRVFNSSLNEENLPDLENGALYWNLVVLIWIFIFPLFYLVA